MGAGANAGRTLEQRLRPIEDRLEIYNLIDIRPPRAVPCRRLYRLGVDSRDRRAEARTFRASNSSRQGSR